MTPDAPTLTVGRRRRHVVRRSEAERQALMAEYQRWDGTQVSFCEAKGVAPRTLLGWFSKRGPAAAATSSKPAATATAVKSASFVEIAAAAGPGWDVELSLGEGVTLRLRRS